MKFYSTKNPGTFFSPDEAVLKSLPDDNGLFMPERLPVLPDSFFSRLHSLTLQEIAFEISKAYFAPEIPENVIQKIVADAINFPLPVKKIKDDTHILELFHGPTLAFKDVGARFMARLMSWLNRNETQKLTVLVATSGDTGSAVANGFQGVEGIEVIILYPSGKVSPLQEKQLTTCGGNISAVEVQGSFDDCQQLVKTAFLDPALSKKYRLTSANSINIARLIPQSFYYIEACRQLPAALPPPVFVVPSGNFGNLTAGLLAMKAGLKVGGYIAATNRNDAVPRYIGGSDYAPGKTIPTISNAMDVGNPSNFVRMLDLFGNSREEMQDKICAIAFDDDQTRAAMRTCYHQHNYMLDPHGAIAWAAWERLKSNYAEGTPGVLLETAHPVKFSEVVAETLGITPEIPASMTEILSREKIATLLSADYDRFRDFLLSR
jgi:threonine synthase